PFMPDQPQTPCPVRDVTRPRTDPTLQRHGEHPTAGARRRGLVRGHDMHHPAAECVRRDAVDREAAQVEQTRGVRFQILLNTGNSRTLRQARGLTLIMNTVLTTAMITRSRASYVSALDPSYPIKSEEPTNVETTREVIASIRERTDQTPFVIVDYLQKVPPGAPVADRRPLVHLSDED